MEENTSKVFVAGDANLAAASLMTVGGTGSSLFVINLCASMAPAPNVGKSLPGLDPYRLYQVARREDGRTRYRLRLGFFTSEAAAEAVLNSVRAAYPTAFTACLCDEDRKFARGFVTEPAAPAPTVAPPRMSVVDNNKASAKPVPAKAAPAAAATPAVATPAPVARPTPPNHPTSMAQSSTLAAAATPKAAAARADASSTGMFKLANEPVATPTARSAPQSAQAAGTPRASVEVELSWDPPPLQAASPAPGAAPTQVVTPAFKTQDVIKAPAAATATAVAPAQVAAAKAPVAKPAAAVKPAPAKQTIEAPSQLLASIELTLESEPTPALQQEPVAPSSNEPFRVGKGVEIPPSMLTLQAESAPAQSAAKPTATISPPVATRTAKPTAEISRMKAAQGAAPSAIKAAVAPPIRKVGEPPPELDTTQTIRALTNDELNDESQEKWFAIQLAVSDQPVNLDAMPRLDIFEAYRVYSVASAGSGKITHSLRIGFFREEVSAEAVSGYLKTFFSAPTVVRISIAEQARFKDAPVAKPAAKEAKVLDLSHARDRAPKTIPTVTMAVDTPKFDPSATGSFKTSGTGVHKALNATGTHKAFNATGTHKALKAASKSAPPATKRSEPLSKSSATGKHKTLQPKKSLSQQLLDEAREVELSASGIRKLPKNDSLLSKMFGKRPKG